MIQLKKELYGVDVKIQEMQIALYDFFDKRINAFGRAVFLERDGNVFPAYHYKETDFKEILPTKENFKFGCFYFEESETSLEEKNQTKVDVSVVFVVDIFTAFPGKKELSDEYLKSELSELFKDKRFFENKEIDVQKGNGVLKGIKTSIQHLQPYCLLKFSGTVKYFKTNC